VEDTARGNVIIEDRIKLTVTGVIDVDSFDNENIILITELGMLIVAGENFRINKLNVDVGEIVIEGEIDALTYKDNYGSRNKGGFLSKMFK